LMVPEPGPEGGREAKLSGRGGQGGRDRQDSNARGSGGRDRNGEIKIKITSKMIPEGRRQNPKKRRGIANGRLKMAD